MQTSDYDSLLARAAAVADRCAEHAATSDRSGESNTAGTQPFPSEEFQWIAEAGLLAAALPRKLGGAGLESGRGNAWPLLRLLKQIGRGSLPVGRVYEGHVNALVLIALFGSEEQLTRAANDVQQAQRIFGVWNAEEAGGIRFVESGEGGYRLEGSKIFCSGAENVSRPIVTGRLPSGAWQMCIVPMEQARPRIDHSWWQPVGMEATVSAAVDFTGVELTPEDLIGPPDAYYRDPWFNGGAIRFAAVQLGGAEALYDAARAHLRRLGRLESVAQHIRFADLARAIESGNLWLQGAAAAWERPPEDANLIATYGAMTRTAIEAICQDVMRDVARAVGARGMMRPEPFGRMVRDLTMYLRQPAPDAVNERIGRYVLEDARRGFELWS